MSEIRTCTITNTDRKRWNFTNVDTANNERWEIEVDEGAGGFINLWVEEGDIGGRGAERHGAGADLTYEQARSLIEFLHPIVYGEPDGTADAKKKKVAVYDSDGFNQWGTRYNFTCKCGNDVSCNMMGMGTCKVCGTNRNPMKGDV